MDIIPRSAWGARYADGFGPAPLPAQECWLHHSVTTAPDVSPPYDDDYAAVQQLEQIGQDRFGGGISYTWLITPAGLIFQGHSPGRQGAHTANRNDRARAICFIGNYDVAAPTTAQLRAAAWLLQHAAAMGWLREARLTGGHRDVGQTACPGQHAYARIGDINALAAGPPITNQEDDTMKNLVLGQAAGSPAVWVGDGLSRRHVTDPNELDGLQYWIGKRGGDPEVHRVDDLRVLGVEVSQRADTGYARDQLLAEVAQVSEVDLDELAAALATRLTPAVQEAVTAAVGDSATLTPDEVQTATEAALRTVLGGLDRT